MSTRDAGPTFTALTEREVEFLRWMAEDLVVGRWDGRSLTLVLKEADTVYQTGLPRYYWSILRRLPGAHTRPHQ